MKKCVLLLDPQNDFCSDQGVFATCSGPFKKVNYNYSTGIANKIKESINEIDSVVLMLDSHYLHDISHSCYWIDFEGQHPLSGTVITKKEVKGKKYQVFSPSLPPNVLEEKQKMAVEYLENIESVNKKHIIQPTHCVIGTVGHNVYQPILDSILSWSKERGLDYQVVLKGMHQHTEHFGAFEAVVPNPNIPETMLNQGILQYLDHFDDVYIWGGDDVLMNSLIQLTECAEALDAPDIIERYVVITENDDIKKYCEQRKYRYTNIKDLKI